MLCDISEERMLENRLGKTVIVIVKNNFYSAVIIAMVRVHPVHLTTVAQMLSDR